MNAAARNDPDMDEAAEIYQHHLDVVSNLLLAGEVTECIRHFGLPILIRTQQSEVLFERAEDLMADTQAHSESLRGHGVTNYIRLVKRARRLSETVIEGWHETYVLHNANSILPSYMSHMFLQLDETDGLWKVAEAEHELGKLRFPLHAVDSQPGSYAHRWEHQLSDVRAIHTRAEPVYSAFLDVLDRTQNAADFDAWAATFQFPLEAHYDDADRTYPTAESARDFFDAMVVKMRNGQTKMTRTISSANFISADRILGYHDTIITEDSTRTFGPVKSRMILTLDQGRWLCTSVTNSMAAPDGSTPGFSLSKDIPTMRDIQKRMNKK